ncbi:hypothetical protein F5146DRAFT_1134204 [Armillaria mellea]|nr:hypothetical protein F5146DRAFT_1134204 [Armillaria mellea]
MSFFPLLVYTLLLMAWLFACFPSKPSRFSEFPSAQIYHIESGLRVQSRYSVSLLRICWSLWISTSDTKDAEELARHWVKVAVSARLTSNLALLYVAISSVSVSLLAAGIDSVFDIGSNVVPFWTHLKAEKLDLNKWHVSGTHLEDIRNIVYGRFFDASVNLVVVVESAEITGIERGWAFASNIAWSSSDVHIQASS